MQDFDQLRQLARDKRDQAIAAARVEYRISLEAINELQQRLTAKPSQRGRPKPLVPMRMKIMDVVPVDRCWTVDELIGWLNLSKTEKNHLRATLTKMKKAGSIKHVRRGKRNVIALFAVADYESQECELNGMTQVQAARAVAAEIGDTDVMTLAVEMVQRGYKHGAQSNGEFVKSLGYSLRRASPASTD